MRHSGVVHNYSHMTVAQIAATVISLCIYPYVIRRVGADTYGWYVFGVSLTGYFSTFISFGLRFPAVKAVVEQIGDRDATNRTVTTVYAIKAVLTAISLLGFATLVVSVPSLRVHWALMLCVFGMVLHEMLMPQWLYQGRQEMQYVTYISVGARLLSVPFIFALVKSDADIEVYAALSSGCMVLAAVACTVYAMWRYDIRFVRVSLAEIKAMARDSLPFLSSDAIAAVKAETVTILIGSLLGMRSVALYDLANKIVNIPRLFITNINNALFPAVVADKSKDVRRIIRMEYLVGLAAFLIVTLCAYPAVLILGGVDMLAAIPVVVIVSLTIITYLVVGAYISFVFVPNRRYYLVTYNQVVAFSSFLLLGVPAVLVWNSVYALVAALALSGFAEIVFCRIVIRKNRLL